MKVLSLLLLILFISEIGADLDGFKNHFCTEYTGTLAEQQAFSKDFCRTLGLEEGYAQCCYVKYKISESTYYNCIQLTLAQLNDMDTAKDYARQQLKSDDIKSLLCTSSSYLYGSILLFLFILF